jgi:hypothetical protein
VLARYSPLTLRYFIESDMEASPFTRESRSLVYQRAKGDIDTMPLGINPIY